MRAIRAAAAMQAALPALNDEFRASWGIELQNHIGVNTGEVIAGDAAPRPAAGDRRRGEHGRPARAGGGRRARSSSATSPIAWRSDQIEVEAIAPLTLKGKAEPVAGVSGSSRSAARTPSAPRSRAPFVGREAEMDRLEMTLAGGRPRARSCGS